MKGHARMRESLEKQQDERLAVFVPASPTGWLARTVARGSAIIGSATSDDWVMVDYEGALYGQSTLRTYADRARRAAERHLAHYPTIARALVTRSALRQVGWFDPQRGIILFEHERDAVASWLHVQELDPKELLFSE